MKSFNTTVLGLLVAGLLVVGVFLGAVALLLVVSTIGPGTAYQPFPPGGSVRMATPAGTELFLRSDPSSGCIVATDEEGSERLESCGDPVSGRVAGTGVSITVLESSETPDRKGCVRDRVYEISDGLIGFWCLTE